MSNVEEQMMRMKESGLTNEWWLGASEWMGHHYEVPVLICAVYVATIFLLQRLLKDRKEGFSLNGSLIIWNCFLAAFSILGTISFSAKIWLVISEDGLQGELCNSRSEKTIWPFLFAMSKILELFDTIFLVLRKRPVRFLHWYHHVATLIYCWDAQAIHIENGGGFALMNLAIHSVMYAYYAASAAGVRFSGFIRQSITTLQIVQMLLGVLLTVHNLAMCNDHPINLWCCLLMYISYTFLFTHLYIYEYTDMRSAAKKASHQLQLNKDSKIHKND